MDINYQARNEAEEKCCQDCPKRYWEACFGLSEFFGQISGCQKAKEAYKEALVKYEKSQKNY